MLTLPFETKGCVTNSTLQEHIKNVHELAGQRPLACHICQRNFKRKNNLKKHLSQKHEGKKPEFTCSSCGKAFFALRTLQRHIDNVHEKLRPYACKLCDLKFAQKGHLTTHIKGKHKNSSL